MATKTIKVSVEVPNFKAEPMSNEQYFRMIEIAEKTQSFLPYESVTLIEFILIAIECFGKYYRREEQFREKLEIFKKKYYPYGVKPNKKISFDNGYSILIKWRNPRFFVGFMPEPYRPIEKVAFLKAVRAYRDCFDNGMTSEAIDTLVDKLKDIHIMMTGKD